MSDTNKTVIDVIREIRAEADYIEKGARGSLKAGETLAGTPFTESDLESALDLAETKRKEADHLEAALKRELAALRDAVVAARRVLAVWGDELPLRAWDEKGEALDKCDAALREGGSNV